MTIRSNRKKTAAMLGASVVLVGIVLVLINVLSASTFMRLDLTQQQEFTISSATKQVLRGLNDLVTITVYMNKDLPPQLATLRRQISDILDEYRNYGHGKVQIEFVDPTGNPELEQRLRMLGIPQITAQTLARDQFQAINVYLGIHIAYLDRQEVIPIVQDTFTLEYDLTSKILKVSRDNEYVVGVLTGPTLHDLNNDLTNLKSLLEEQYRVRTVSLGEGEEAVPDEVNVLIVAGPSRVPDAVKYRLDQYLMRGGKIIYLMDEIRLPQDGGLQALPVASDLEDLLARYGVRVQKSLVLDRLSETATFSSGYIRYTLPYPYWPKAVPELLNSDNPITQRLESLTLPWVAPLEVDAPIGPGDPIDKIHELEQADARRQMAEQTGTEPPAEESEAANKTQESTPTGPVVASVLARTSPQSWTISGRYDLNPQQRYMPGGEEPQSHIVAAALQGEFDSYYSDHPVPTVGAAPTPEGGAPETQQAAAAQPLGPPLLHSPQTQLLVVGNGHFITDSFVSQFPENSVFFLNAIDWMTIGDELIAIRSRGATSRPLAQISDTTKSVVKLLCIAGAPLLVVIFGLARLSMRRRASNAQEIAAREN